jgi:hypothetical protein
MERAMDRRRFFWILGQVGWAALAACSGGSFIPRRDGGGPYDLSIPGGPSDGGPPDFALPYGNQDLSTPVDLNPYGEYDGFYYASGGRFPGESALARLGAHARDALAPFERLTDLARG